MKGALEVAVSALPFGFKNRIGINLFIDGLVSSPPPFFLYLLVGQIPWLQVDARPDSFANIRSNPTF
jgi:hypothetical protein